MTLACPNATETKVSLRGGRTTSRPRRPRPDGPVASVLPATHPVRRLHPWLAGWEFGTFVNGHCFARCGNRLVPGETLGYLIRVLYAEQATGQGAWWVAA
jgi:hypothetical protein